MTPDVYLASSSPRRKELLAQLGVQFAVIVPQVDETRLALEPPEHYVGRLAVAKARAGRQLLQDGSSLTVKPVIGADTCVVVADDLVGKPKNKAHFMHLMEQLSGATHQVYSAVAIAGGLDNTRNTQLTDDTHSGPKPDTLEKCLVSCTSVQFRRTSLLEREWYWRSGEPQDKAGGYAIQGLAAAFVKNITGSYSAVVGLPLFETAQLLNEFGINPGNRVLE
jgi:septum formation protein